MFAPGTVQPLLIISLILGLNPIEFQSNENNNKSRLLKHSIKSRGYTYLILFLITYSLNAFFVYPRLIIGTELFISLIPKICYVSIICSRTTQAYTSLIFTFIKRNKFISIYNTIYNIDKFLIKLLNNKNILYNMYKKTLTYILCYLIYPIINLFLRMIFFRLFLTVDYIMLFFICVPAILMIVIKIQFIILTKINMYRLILINQCIEQLIYDPEYNVDLTWWFKLRANAPTTKVSRGKFFQTRNIVRI